MEVVIFSSFRSCRLMAKQLGMLFLLLLCCSLTAIEAYDILDPNGNITIKWDVKDWTEDGYIANVTMNNYQMYRHIGAPGWTLGWKWTDNEIIWDMFGAQATEEGECANFKIIPHCCKSNPTVVDLLPGAPYNKQVPKCCKGGVISSWVQDSDNAVSSFRIIVGHSGNTNNSVKFPANFTLSAPGPGYTCGSTQQAKPTQYISEDGRRITQALMTWDVICTYSEFLSHTAPTCCVSLSSFYNNTIVDCPTCSCGCQDNNTQPGSCVEGDSPYLDSAITGAGKNNLTPLVQCTPHMCPIRVHWHVKLNYKQYWRAKVTITNFNYLMNYSQWNLVVQHPNFDNLTQIFSFAYESLTPYGSINDTAMLWGFKYYNDMLMAAGSSGNVQSELLFQKDSSFTFHNGWAFPRRLYFNGDSCVMPPPDAYPWLPNASPMLVTHLFLPLVAFLAALVYLLGYI